MFLCSPAMPFQSVHRWLPLPEPGLCLWFLPVKREFYPYHFSQGLAHMELLNCWGFPSNIEGSCSIKHLDC